MKTLIKLTALTTLLLLVACNTTTQQKSYNTIYTLEKATTSAYSAYVDCVIESYCATNGFDKVSQDYNKFHAASLFALTLVHNDTNALAPSSLVVESGDLINLINEVKGGR